MDARDRHIRTLAGDMFVRICSQAAEIEEASARAAAAEARAERLAALLEEREAEAARPRGGEGADGRKRKR